MQLIRTALVPTILAGTLLGSVPAMAAGTAVWVAGTPDPTLTPERIATTPEQLAPSQAWSDRDLAAIAHLAAELDAVRPLKDELDGEIQIMRRLEAALDPVALVRAQDRDLVWRALILQGYAAHRYFQDTLARDPAATAWREQVGDSVEVRAWVSAISLDPDRVPTAEEIPDEPDRVAYGELRARQLLLPAATVQIEGLPDGTRLVVDGIEATGARQAVPTGRHTLGLWRGEELVQRERVDLDSGEVHTIPALADDDDLRALAGDLAGQPDALLLAAPVLARLATAEAPVELVVPGKRAPERYVVTGNSAVHTEVLDQAAGDPGGGAALTLDLAGGGAWIYDANYLTENLDDGAPTTAATVNAAAPAVTLGLSGELGHFAVGTGVDLALPLGSHHDLPVGSNRMRLRTYPHLSVGHRYLRLTGGALLPWHLGLGARLQLPVPLRRDAPLQLVAAYTHGLALHLEGSDGHFEADAARMAWVGLGDACAWPVAEVRGIPRRRAR